MCPPSQQCRRLFYQLFMLKCVFAFAVIPKCFLMKAEMFRARNNLSTRSIGGKPVETAFVDNDGIYDPECENDGKFKAIQCNNTDTCWCVNSAGVRRSDKADKSLKCEPVETQWVPFLLCVSACCSLTWLLKCVVCRNVLWCCFIDVWWSCLFLSSSWVRIELKHKPVSTPLEKTQLAKYVFEYFVLFSKCSLVCFDWFLHFPPFTFVSKSAITQTFTSRYSLPTTYVKEVQVRRWW